jgi:hypothetical protein
MSTNEDDVFNAPVTNDELLDSPFSSKQLNSDESYVEKLSQDTQAMLLEVALDSRLMMRKLAEESPDAFLKHVVQIVQSVNRRNSQAQTNVQLNWINYLREAEAIVEARSNGIDAEKGVTGKIYKVKRGAKSGYKPVVRRKALIKRTAFDVDRAAVVREFVADCITVTKDPHDYIVQNNLRDAFFRWQDEGFQRAGSLKVLKQLYVTFQQETGCWRDGYSSGSPLWRGLKFKPGAELVKRFKK